MVWSKREGSMDRCNHVDIGLSGISVCSAVFELMVGASTLPPNVQPSPCRFSRRFCRSAIEDEQATTIPHLAGGARSIAGPCDILTGIYRACSLSQGFLAPSVFSTRYLCLLWPRDAAIYPGFLRGLESYASHCCEGKYPRAGLAFPGPCIEGLSTCLCLKWCLRPV